MKKFSNNGFSLVELMVTLSVVAILAIVGLPGMIDFIKNERLTTQINSLLVDLQHARSEALTRHEQVTVCASKDGATCSGGDWEDGWIVMITATSEVLRIRDELEGDNTLSSSSGATITYDQRGFAPNVNATFSVCDDRGASYGKSISVSNTGRIRSGGNVSC